MATRKRTDQERVVEYFTAVDPTEAALTLKTVQAILRARVDVPTAKPRARKAKDAPPAKTTETRTFPA
jgi:hypothetical protein